MERSHAADAVPMTAADVIAMSQNMALLLEAAGEATSAYLGPEEKRDAKAVPGEAFSEMANSLGRLAEHWTSEPDRALAAQARLGAEWFDLWANSLKRMQVGETSPSAASDARDKRFASPEWSENPFFDYLRQAYLATSRWADSLARDARMDPHERHKAEFYIRQLSSALAPSNFLATNPELLRQTVEEKGANLVRGMKMLAEDIKAGNGELRLRQTDPGGFEVGVNIANTPGKVVFRNELMELLQYAPSTPTVLKRPLLIVPPWINKFYVLDLNPEKSFIRWAVAQGLTVFCISWVNPDERHADKGFGDYMREGVFAALDAIEEATGETDVTAIGYCVGGTMLAVALAYAAATGDRRISSATFFTTQVDFTHCGDLKVFVDEAQVKGLEERMGPRGYLEGSRMANAFNMLRPNDLIWPYVINNYLKGKTPVAFDLLYWNSDSTRMPAANHSFYLRGCYLNNSLSKGEMIVENVRLDLKKVEIPIFNLAAREDHIAPAKSAFLGSGLFGGKVDFVLAGSGHIAGVVNPAGKPKYQFWTGGTPEGDLDSWLENATEHPGSWWPHWFAWVEQQAPERVPARIPGEGRLPALEDAPGSYVKVRS